MIKKNIRKLSILYTLVLMFSLLTINVSAENVTVDLFGHYAHPNTGIIEDSGGKSNEALGQSMVENIMFPQGGIESKDGKSYLNISFKLMNSIDEIVFYTGDSESASWDEINHEVVATRDDEADLKIDIPQTNTILRCTAYIVPMGRSVIFYISYKPSTGTTPTTSVTTESTNSSNKEDNRTLDEILDDTVGLSYELSSNDKSPSDIVSDGNAEDKKDSQNNNSSLNNKNYVLDDSLWGPLFLILMGATLCSGIILIFINMGIKKLLENRKNKSNSINFDVEEEFIEDDFNTEEINFD